MLSSDNMRIPEKEVLKLLEDVDLNNDKEINYNEFIEMMKKDLKI